MPRRNRHRFVSHTPQKQKTLVDRGVLFLCLGFLILGLIAVADTSAPLALSTFADSFYFVKQQLLWTVAGIVILFVSLNIHYSFWKKMAYPLFGLSVLLLILVLIPGFSSKVYGARRWLNLGFFSVQPSEIVKVTIIILFARFAEEKRRIFYYLVPLAVVSGLIMLEPDLGTTIIVLVIGFTQIFLSGVNLFYLLATLIGGGFLGTLVVLFSGYRKQRLLTFLNSTSDPLGSSYHIRQILLALGSGGLFGIGLGQSRQKYLFLPEVATDSVFAIIGEELGFVGAFVLVCLFAVFIYKMIRIVSKAPDTFASVLSVGVVAWIGGQMLLNLAAMTALVPLTGIPLPFFSYGGSHLTTQLLSIGILLNISRYAKEKQR